MLFTITRADIHLGAASAGDLNRHVTGCTEAVEAEARARPVVDAGLCQAAVADDAGTKERRRLEVRKAVGE